MVTDLALNYANFAHLNVWNFAPLHVCITKYATLIFDPLNVLRSIYSCLSCLYGLSSDKKVEWG